MTALTLLFERSFGLAKHAVDVVVSVASEQEVDLDLVKIAKKHQPSGKSKHGSILVLRARVVHLDEDDEIWQQGGRIA